MWYRAPHINPYNGNHLCHGFWSRGLVKEFTEAESRRKQRVIRMSLKEENGGWLGKGV
jgi:hypothetical protein